MCGGAAGRFCPMPQLPIGEVRKTSSGYSARHTTRKGERETFEFHPAIRTIEAAEARSAVLGDLAQRFRKSGAIESADAIKLLHKVAEVAEDQLAHVLLFAEKVIAGEVRHKTAEMPTFAAFAERWTSGELAQKHPDHVKAKDSAIDKQRLAWIC